jgi:hypothetical protein
MDNQQIMKNLDKLIAYMKKRANMEGVIFELDLDYFQGVFDFGIREFFGIKLDDQAQMIFDEQEPQEGFFEKNK